MDGTQHNVIVSFIWGIADDVLRDVYVRGKYRDVILPMTVIRRLDVLLEPTKQAVLDMKQRLDAAGVANPEAALCDAAGQNRKFYNTSQFTLKRLLDNPKQLQANFTDYLNGFSGNVAEIIEKFDFHNQLKKLTQADVLGNLIEKFVDKKINLSPQPVLNDDGSEKLPGLSNHGMGSVFEELIRRFSEDNNEEAGEHFTPRDIVHLMTNLIFVPVKDEITDATYRVYDCACGTGGMLTEADDTLHKLAAAHQKSVSTHLFGQEVNAETYAICKADLLIKGEDEKNIAFGSTLSNDVFPRGTFDFMLANPPYGKSWKTDLERLGSGNKKEISDARFVVNHDGNPALSLVSRSSDGQLMFLVNMLSKMNHETALGSRIVTVHNGSSLFTGDAGQGESNIRQWIIENDWLEAIIGLPENMFYNTGIATYIWVLTNRKPAHRRGKVQLVDATQWFTKLRKNLGKKNCKFDESQIEQIIGTFLACEESEQSKIFDNNDFGYWQIKVERPLRLKTGLTPEHLASLRGACEKADEEPLANVAERVAARLGGDALMDYNVVWEAVKADADAHNVKLTAKREKLFREFACERNEAAKPVIARLEKLKANESPDESAELYGAYPTGNAGARFVVRYEPDAELRDYENVPLKDDIEAYFRREVAPHVLDAWIDRESTRKGYEVSFTKYFYRYQPLRSLAEISDELLLLESKTEGLLKQIVAAA